MCVCVTQNRTLCRFSYENDPFARRLKFHKADPHRAEDGHGDGVLDGAATEGSEHGADTEKTEKRQRSK